MQLKIYDNVSNYVKDVITGCTCLSQLAGVSTHLGWKYAEIFCS